MKEFMKRSAALLIAFIMVISFVPGTVFTAFAASYTYNWGTRGEVATELSDSAVEFYEKYNVTYEELSALSGSSSTSSVPSSALYTELKDLMTNAHTTKTSYDGTKSMYQYTDCQNGGGKISSFYSGTAIGPGWGEGGSWNREHTWPKSKSLNGSSNGGQDETDIMMLRPTATSENSSRGNTAYGEGSSYYDPNDESNGAYNLHGDVARIVLYVYVRWGNTSYMWGSSGVMESKEVLLKWMEEDPVDTWELGRNDAVESITGTRNVFVDYPELAFDLFEEEVPTDMDTPSGGTVSYNITAQPNNSSYGTVSLSGKKITAYPYEGYYVSGYQLLNGTATVTQDGNTFTVSAQSDCTVQINFAAKTKVTVVFSGTNVASQSGYAGESMSLPTADAPEGFTFLGWMSTALSSDTTEKPTYFADSYIPNGNTTLYPLYSYVDETSGSGSGDYVKVTSAPSDWSGEYVIVYEADGYIFNSSLTTMDAVSNYKAVTITDNTITAADADPYKFTISAMNGGYSILGASGSYIGGQSGSNKLVTGSSELLNTIALDASGNATIISNTSHLRFNATNGQYRFRYYRSGSFSSQKPIALYVKDGSVGATYYTSVPVTCNHVNTTEIAAVAATCTTTGFTAGIQCDDCGNIISGHDVINALGHSWGEWAQSMAPGCETAGEESRTCGTCSEIETQSVAATGHSYHAVVTDPTATEQGYTTYTCLSCGDSYVSDYTEAVGESYTVSFVVPESVTAIADMSCNKYGITLPEANVPIGDYDYVFAGWFTSQVDNTEEKPEYYKAGETYYATSNISLCALYTYVIGGSGSVEYILTDIADIDSSDVVVITMTYTENGTVYALDNDNGTSSAPTAVVISAADGKLTEDPADNLKWNIGGSADAYIFYPQGSTTTWLYCTSTNNGVRVGTNSSKTFAIDSATGYLKHTSTNRYVGVYRGNPDWRCYTSPTTNIGSQSLGFYVESESGTTYYTTRIINSCPHDSYVDGICTNCGAQKPELVAGMDMLLSDDMKVNFYLNEQTDVIISVAGVETTYTADQLIAAEDGKYIATISVAAAQMMDSITIRATDEDASAGDTVYTVRSYADTILANEAYSQYHTIVKEMLNYGAAAQTYFGYNAENLANVGITDVGASEIPEAADKDVSITDNVSGINFYAASLVYKDKVAVRFYFDGESIDGLTFTVDGAAYDAVLKGDYYMIEVSDICPESLSDQVTVVVTDAEGNALNVSYGPMNYIVRMGAKGDDSLKALLKALYNYHLAAKELRVENA